MPSNTAKCFLICSHSQNAGLKVGDELTHTQKYICIFLLLLLLYLVCLLNLLSILYSSFSIVKDVLHTHTQTHNCTLEAVSHNVFYISLVACVYVRVCVCVLSQMLISVVYDLSIIFPFFVRFLLNILAVASYGWCCKCQQLNSWRWGHSGFHMKYKAAGRMQFKIKVDNSHGMKSTNLQNTLCKRERERKQKKWRNKQTNNIK